MRSDDPRDIFGLTPRDDAIRARYLERFRVLPPTQVAEIATLMHTFDAIATAPRREALNSNVACSAESVAGGLKRTQLVNDLSNPAVLEKIDEKFAFVRDITSVDALKQAMNASPDGTQVLNDADAAKVFHAVEQAKLLPIPERPSFSPLNDRDLPPKIDWPKVTPEAKISGATFPCVPLTTDGAVLATLFKMHRLDHGFSGGDNFGQKVGQPVLALCNTQSIRVTRPPTTFSSISGTTSESTYAQAFESRGGTLSFHGSGKGFSANIKAEFTQAAAQESRAMKSRAYASIRIDWAVMTIDPDAFSVTRTVLDSVDEALASDRPRHRLLELEALYGRYIATKVAIGVFVQAEQTSSKAADETRKALLGTFSAALNVFTVEGKAALETFKQSQSGTWKTASESKLSTNAAGFAPSWDSLSDIVKVADDLQKFGVNRIEEVASIWEFLPPSRRERVAIAMSNNNPYSVKVFTKEFQHMLGGKECTFIPEDPEYVIVGGGACVSNGVLSATYPLANAEGRCVGWAAAGTENAPLRVKCIGVKSSDPARAIETIVVSRGDQNRVAVPQGYTRVSGGSGLQSGHNLVVNLPCQNHMWQSSSVAYAVGIRAAGVTFETTIAMDPGRSSVEVDPRTRSASASNVFEFVSGGGWLGQERMTSIPAMNDAAMNDGVPVGWSTSRSRFEIATFVVAAVSLQCRFADLPF